MIYKINFYLVTWYNRVCFISFKNNIEKFFDKKNQKKKFIKMYLETTLTTFIPYLRYTFLIDIIIKKLTTKTNN
jgi:hypothetical protein